MSCGFIDNRLVKFRAQFKNFGKITKRITVKLHLAVRTSQIIIAKYGIRIEFNQCLEG